MHLRDTTLIVASWNRFKQTKKNNFLAQVLEVAPKEWTVQIVDKFLRRSVRQSLHMQRMFRIEQGLYRSFLLHRFKVYELISISSDKDNFKHGQNGIDSHVMVWQSVMITSAAIVWMKHQMCLLMQPHEPYGVGSAIPKDSKRCRLFKYYNVNFPNISYKSFSAVY